LGIDHTLARRPTRFSTCTVDVVHELASLILVESGAESASLIDNIMQEFSIPYAYVDAAREGFRRGFRNCLSPTRVLAAEIETFLATIEERFKVFFELFREDNRVGRDLHSTRGLRELQSRSIDPLMNKSFRLAEQNFMEALSPFLKTNTNCPGVASFCSSPDMQVVCVYELRVRFSHIFPRLGALIDFT